MMVIIDAAFWDIVGRLADVTWLIAFGSADAWVVMAAWRHFRKSIQKANGKH
jgi:hypothetical protein